MKSPGSFRKLNVLVVDDNANMRRLVRTVLQSFGCGEAPEADGVEDALHIIAAQEIDVVVADLLMQPLDGFDLIRALRDPRSPNPYIPVVMMTGCASLHAITEARDAGVNELLAKPISAEHLYQRLRAVIERPRPFVRAKAYFGPDRRRRSPDGYGGPERRDEEDAPALAEGAL